MTGQKANSWKCGQEGVEDKDWVPKYRNVVQIKSDEVGSKLLGRKEGGKAR